jgi:hypothetical protein
MSYVVGAVIAIAVLLVVLTGAIPKILNAQKSSTENTKNTCVLLVRDGICAETCASGYVTTAAAQCPANKDGKAQRCCEKIPEVPADQGTTGTTTSQPVINQDARKCTEASAGAFCATRGDSGDCIIGPHADCSATEICCIPKNTASSTSPVVTQPTTPTVDPASCAAKEGTCRTRYVFTDPCTRNGGHVSGTCEHSYQVCCAQ